ncbi:MAG: lipoate--protein ligase [Deltaproteobacteria bacterium]|jgi:lipoate-protein ligase A|nr:lipoate--protein ligase [Deltaproteobacteria bacterium]
MKILRLESTEPYWNLALEEHLLLSRDNGDYLLLWQNANTIVVGLHQNTREEINQAFVDERQVRVVRRRSGGGAVYHDLGNLNFSFITARSQADANAMRRFTLPVVRALRGLGLAAQADGRNDITVNGLKVSGNAQALHEKRILHHGTLLFAADLGLLSQALRVNPAKFASKSVKSVRSRVGNIRDFLPPALAGGFNTDSLAQTLLREMERECGGKLEELRLTAEDLQATSALRESKYLTRKWNYGRSPNCNFRNQRKYGGGFLEALLDIRRDRIASCRFYGDFLSLRPAAEVEALLAGTAYERESVAARLRSLPLAEYFGAISLEEVLDCLFNP